MRVSAGESILLHSRQIIAQLIAFCFASILSFALLSHISLSHIFLPVAFSRASKYLTYLPVSFSRTCLYLTVLFASDTYVTFSVSHLSCFLFHAHLSVSLISLSFILTCISLSHLFSCASLCLTSLTVSVSRVSCCLIFLRSGLCDD